MTDLVGDDVGLRELAPLAAGRAAAEARLDLAEERRVEVDLLIVGTIERTHRGLGGSAGRPRGAREHDQRRRAIGHAAAAQYLGPAVFGVAQHRGHELPHLIVGRTGLAWLRRGRLGGFAAARQDLGAADQQARVDPQRPADEAEDHNRADADAAPATDRDAEPATSLVTPAVFDVVAAAEIIPAHEPLHENNSAATAPSRAEIAAPFGDGAAVDTAAPGIAAGGAAGSGRPVHERGGFLSCRQAPVGRELVDHVRKNFRQLRKQLLLGHPAALRQLFENVGTKRRPELIGRNLLVLAGAYPRVDLIAQAVLLEAVEQPAKAAEEPAIAFVGRRGR